MTRKPIGNHTDPEKNSESHSGSTWTPLGKPLGNPARKPLDIHADPGRSTGACITACVCMCECDGHMREGAHARFAKGTRTLHMTQKQLRSHSDPIGIHSENALKPRSESMQQRLRRRALEAGLTAQSVLTGRFL